MTLRDVELPWVLCGDVLVVGVTHYPPTQSHAVPGRGGPGAAPGEMTWGRMTVTITGHAVVVTLCWIAGIAFAIIDVLYVPDWAALSTAFLIGAATLTVRRRVDKYAANWTQAYEIGRDEGKVRRVR